jgi:signal peptidase II
MSSKKALLLFFICGVFLLLDQGLKWQSTHAWSKPALVATWLGWYPFLNPGVAFSIPLPPLVVLFVTIPLILLMVWQLVRLYSKSGAASMLQFAAFSFIITGAISNIIDRVSYHNTLDYFLIWTGVINVADVMIVLGFIVLFISLKRER